MPERKVEPLVSALSPFEGRHLIMSQVTETFITEHLQALKTRRRLEPASVGRREGTTVRTSSCG